MKLTHNIIALQKGFVCAPNNENNNLNEVATVQTNLMQFGYMLNGEAMDNLKKSSISFIRNFNDEVLNYLKNVLGGSHNFTPLYKNFPEEVMSKSDCELFVNAILHYLTHGAWEPSTVTYEKPISFESIDYTIIGWGDTDKFNSIFTDLVSLNTSLRPQDMEIINWFVTNKQPLIFPTSIPFKETLCTLASFGLEGLPIKTTTDVLRICVSLSGGDISLPKVPKKSIKTRYGKVSDNPLRSRFKFKKFSRKERRYILGLLEKTNCDPKEMVLRDQRWIRLGEILHPGEFKTKYPKAFKAFDQIRNNKIKSWFGLLNVEMNKSLEDGLTFLSQKPGEFARRLDSLIRNNTKDSDLILTYFKSVADKISNKVLFELLNHFEKRMDKNSNRSIMVKGSRSKTILKTLEPLSSDIVDNIKHTIHNVLEYKFSQLEPLGKCFIDEELKKIPLPSNLRSVSFSTKPLIRGQRVSFGNTETKVIRPFVHWLDHEGREDLDLSCTFVGTDRTEILNYTNLRVEGSVHSGDVRHRIGPCAEYIDIDINSALEAGFEYVAIDVRNFNGRSLKSVESVFGIMEREKPQANSIWLPETITNAYHLTSESKDTMICILDLKTKEYVMVDADAGGFRSAVWGGTVVLDLIKIYTEDPKFSVYDLIMLHVNSRGELVENIEDADTKFTNDQFLSSYEETGKLMGI